MPFFKKIIGAIKRTLGISEKLIDPDKHHAAHEVFYKIARDMQKEWGFDTETAKKYASRILKLDRAKISEIDRDIIEAHSPD